MERKVDKEQVDIKFKDLEGATKWTLGRLSKDFKPTFFRRKNKYKAALEELEKGNWQPSSSMVREEYESLSDSLEGHRMRGVLFNKPIDSSDLLLKETVFYGILLTLISQRIEITSEKHDHHGNFIRDFDKIGIALSTREYSRQWTTFSVPRLIRELNTLSEVFQD